MNDTAPDVTAGILVIGNEILSGRTRDSNMHHLAGRLTEMGIRLREVRVVPDEMELIVAAVNEMRARFTYLFTSGGIGPTHDDITADAVARAFGLGIGPHPEAVARMERYYPPGQFNEARRRMARTPDGASLIDNPVSIAPGFRVANVFVMAGVPAVFEAMVAAIRHELVGGPKLLSRSVAARLPEGQIAGPLRLVAERFAGVDIGSYPAYRNGVPTTTIVLRAVDAALLDEAAAAVAAMMRAEGAEPQDSAT
jgi:molybdenum cofactor synthesis domain-containing protein